MQPTNASVGTRWSLPTPNILPPHSPWDTAVVTLLPVLGAQIPPGLSHPSSLHGARSSRARCLLHVTLSACSSRPAQIQAAEPRAALGPGSLSLPLTHTELPAHSCLTRTPLAPRHGSKFCCSCGFGFFFFLDLTIMMSPQSENQTWEWTSVSPSGSPWCNCKHSTLHCIFFFHI